MEYKIGFLDRLAKKLSVIFNSEIKSKERCANNNLNSQDGFDKIYENLWRPDNSSWRLFERVEFNAKTKSPNIKTARDLTSKIDIDRIDRYAIKIELEDFSLERLVYEIEKCPQNGGDIYLPQGRIVIDKEVKLKSGIRLIGAQNGTEFVFKDVDFGFNISGSKDSILNGVSLENLKIFHLGVHRFCGAVFISHARAVEFTNIEIINPIAVGFLFADNVEQTTLTRCSVIKAGLVGYMLIRDVNYTLFDSCKAKECEQSGIFLTDLKLPQGVEPLDFNAQIHYTSEVVGNFGPFDPDDPAPCHTTIINSVFDANRKMGITTDGVGYLRVINSIISNNDCEGITIDNGSWCSSIQNCNIYGNGWRGFQHNEELTVDYVESMGLMQDKSSKAKLPGISFDNAAYCQVDSNSIYGNWGDGVKFVRAGYGCNIFGNTICDNNNGQNDKFHFFGVLIGQAARQHKAQADFPSCYNRVENNHILGSHYSGVHLLPGTVGNIVKNNLITGYRFIDIENHAGNSNLLQKLI
ncbi:MAG: right-handed parallel beta-helix repeat-containing protein [Desulfamplus sp.]|nr:right-handed parallel beta-helix repeat-containing protein [Desulfamplus sp.]